MPAAPTLTPPDPRRWSVAAPKAGTEGPLAVTFPAPMNYVLLGRMPRVTKGNTAVEGTIAVERQETLWRFAPRQPWAAGTYTFERVSERIEKATVAIPFTVR